MNGLADFWFARRHEELLCEAAQERLARESRRARKASAGRPAALDADTPTDGHTVVRRGTIGDERRVARLLEINGMPRWVAFEEQFIVVEEGGKLVAALRFREGPGSLLLGLLVTDPWAEEGSLALALYAGARVIARGLGMREVRARTRRHHSHLCEAGYRRRGGVWLISP